MKMTPSPHLLTVSNDQNLDRIALRMNLNQNLNEKKYYSMVSSGILFYKMSSESLTMMS